jgi:GNAT superfamily N-acetyltransferase
MKAMLGALIFPDVNSSDLVATEMFWYSDKNARGCGLALFSAFERWAKENGAKHAIMVHLSNSMPEKLRRFYGKKGYCEVDTHYMKEIN